MERHSPTTSAPSPLAVAEPNFLSFDRRLNEPTQHSFPHLTEKETAIIKYLYRSGDKVIGRDVLLDEVWGYNAGVATHTLETHIYRLRQKIEREPANATLLVTEPGGYRLNP